LAAGDRAVGQEQPVHQHDPVGQPPQEHGGHAGPVGSTSDRGKLVAGRRKAGEQPDSVETPDIPKLPWTIKDGVKAFHLTAEYMKREFLPGQWFDVWGYNGSMPGPTIEAVEGDKVRIIVHNRLPEPTSMHWHGLEVPIAMNGVPGVTQDPIPPGNSFTYEFALHQNGTYFYHTHEEMKEALGLVGLFIIHPKAAWAPSVDRDFGLILQEWAILPGASVTNTMSMEFNVFTINGRSAPYITPMVVRLGDRVRICLVNFSVIDHHPMHLHGLTFWITSTEAGRISEAAWIPRNNVLVGVAQAADIEFVANNPGDWVMHCHMFHHMMNFMSSMVGPMGGPGPASTKGITACPANGAAVRPHSYLGAARL
jgi:FtsP/CotA-like multicopper oxidase with cupredoxin domain